MFKFHNSFINYMIYGLLILVFIPLMLVVNFVFTSEILFMEFSLLVLNSMSINFIVMMDLISSMFLLTVSLITLAVLKFSQSYMASDKHFIRFHYLLLLFVLSMYLLILSPNLISLLLGWDGLGLSSYLLVIYYSSPKAYNSGMITALTNRVGDALILVSISYVMIFGNWNFLFYNTLKISLILMTLLMVAACTKSAQIPFSAWLPAAMAAPTPVSSLVHSSTLVTAGVYILIRHNDLFLINSVSSFLMVIGSMTMVMASLSALFETDLKKMVALSTLSQLGVMVLSLGLGAFIASFFHLLSHAFFKALLFLTAGAIIHGSCDYQDLRLMGGSSKSLPVINSFTMMSSFSLMGIPFMSAFFSKEMILEMIMTYNFNSGSYYLMIFGVALTAMYSSRFISFIFIRSNHNNLPGLKLDEDNFVVMSMFILMVPAVMGGAMFLTILYTSIKLSSTPSVLKVSIIFILILSIITLKKQSLFPSRLYWKWFSWILSSMWLLPLLSAILPITLNSKVSVTAPKILDRGFLNLVMVLFNKYFIFSSVYLPTLKFMFKVISLIIIWISIVVLYYLCNKL